MGGARRSKQGAIDGFGPQATVPLGFLSFWRGLGRLKSILKVLADSRKLGAPKGQKFVELMGLGLRATVPLRFLSFWGGFGSLKSILNVLTDSRHLWGLRGVPGGKNSAELMGLGLKANVPLGLLSFWRGLGRLKSILKVLADSRNLWGFGGCLEVKKVWN